MRIDWKKAGQLETGDGFFLFCLGGGPMDKPKVA